jgi:hypothetical protein
VIKELRLRPGVRVEVFVDVALSVGAKGISIENEVLTVSSSISLRRDMATYILGDGYKDIIR